MSRGPFEVRPAKSLHESLKRLQRLALAKDVYERVGKAIGEIEGHLVLHPETWGDPFREYKHLRLRMYRRLHDKLAVEYGVHEVEPLVFVTALSPALDHPLAGLA